MPDRTPSTTAWQRVRDRVRADAADYRAGGATVIEVFADHGTVRAPTKQPVTFSFTIPDDTVAMLRRQLEDQRGRSRLKTEIQYADADQTRFYVLTVRDEAASLRILIAGGVDHDALTDHTGTDTDTDTDTPYSARTVLRSVTDTIALELRHATLDPFLVGLDP